MLHSRQGLVVVMSILCERWAMVMFCNTYKGCIHIGLKYRLKSATRGEHAWNVRQILQDSPPFG